MSDPTNPPAGSPVYISGPMFSVADLWQQQAIADALETADYTTYLPQRDGIEVGPLMAGINSVNSPEVVAIIQFVREIVFAMDMFQLVARCQSLVFNMDGRVPDDGSVVEAAAGFATGQPIVVYKTTPITMLGGYDNPMVSGLSMMWSTVDDVDKLPAAVAAAVATIGDRTFTTPPHLDAVLRLGSAVWDSMDVIRAAIESADPAKFIAMADQLHTQLQPLLDAAFPGAPDTALAPTGVRARVVDLRRAEATAGTT